SGLVVGEARWGPFSAVTVGSGLVLGEARWGSCSTVRVGSRLVMLVARWGSCSAVKVGDWGSASCGRASIFSGGDKYDPGIPSKLHKTPNSASATFSSAFSSIFPSSTPSASSIIPKTARPSSSTPVLVISSP
ncbi:hypothetical protein ANANG_G00197670, partial [Anguilla anguilla]